MALAGDHVQVLVDGYELTADSHSLSLSDSRDQHDVTVFGGEVHQFINGQRNVALDHQGYVTSAVGRSHPVLQANAILGCVSVLIGQNAAPVIGDPVFSLDTVQTHYQVMPEVAKAIPFKAKFANRGDRGGWGRALAVPISFTNTTSGTALNHGAASSNGGAAFLHLLTAAASDTYSIILQGSATGAFSGEESTLATFSLDASALDSERVALAGSIPQYVRWQATRSGSAGDTVKLAINLVRF